MKRKIIFAVLLIFSLVLVGCGNEKDPVNPQGPDIDNPSSEIDAEFEKVQKLVDEKIPYIVSEDIELFTEIEGSEVYIEWDTSDFNLITPEGSVSPERLEAKEVTLTYIVSFGAEQKEGSKNIIVSPASIEKVAEKFERQFSALIIRDYDVDTKFYGLFTVDWTSSNTELFDNEGKYHKPNFDTEIELRYTISCKEFTSEQMIHKLTVAGVSDVEKMEEITKYIKDEVLQDLYLTEGLTLPTMYEKYKMPISWTSSNSDVISNDGKITHYVYERYVTLFANYALPNGTTAKAKFECVVSPLDITKMSKKEIVDNFVESIAISNYGQVKFGYAEAPNLSTTYGHLYFYLNQKAQVTNMMIPIGTSNRDQTPMVPKLIVVHDTANYRASAKANAAYCQSGYSGGTTSWHYTVGNDGIFQTLPDNECGGHANGSFSQKFNMIDTGIKATVKKPQAYVDEFGHIIINKQKTRFSVPDVKRGYADFGLMVEIGENGNYYLAESWYCGANGRNAVKGGNGNGIGIETSVEKGTDYLLTMRMLAKHIAELLIKHNLTVDRVVQHNTTSGKNCPQAIREANFMYTLKDYVSLEKFAKEHLADCQFAWTSNSPIMDNTGAIAKDLKNNKTVSYSVVVSENSQQITKRSFTTNLIDAK